MKKNIVSIIIYVLISLAVFSLISANSYFYFKSNQDKLFIADKTIIKVLDGEKYQSAIDVVTMLNNKNFNYVLYAKQGHTYYVLNHNYNDMLTLKQKDNIVLSQQIGKYQYEPLDLTASYQELYLSVQGYNEQQLMELFYVNNFPDGMYALFDQGYVEMYNISMFIIIISMLIVINYLYLSLFIEYEKPKIGVMKLLGYDNKEITKMFVKKISICFIISLVIIYIVNYQYISFIFSQRFIFSQMLNIILVYLTSIIFIIFVSGVMVNKLVGKITVIKYFREVLHD